MLQEHISKALSTFQTNVNSVEALMRFDSNVLEFAIQHLETLQNRLKKDHALDNPRFDVENTLSMLRTIRTNDSLQPHYQQMLNQCLVLLVSYFSSAVGDIFRAGVADAVRSGTREKLLKEDVRIRLKDLRDLAPELVERSGELLVAHKQISFQNLEMVATTFRDYFGYERDQDELANDLILAHACRHVIVHNGSIVDRKMIGQLRDAKVRTLKVQVIEGAKVQFTEEEIVRVAKRMTAYLGELGIAVASA